MKAKKWTQNRQAGCYSCEGKIFKLPNFVRKDEYRSYIFSQTSL